MLTDRALDRAVARTSWYAPDERVESLLFGAVQTLMFACTVLLVAHLLAGA